MASYPGSLMEHYVVWMREAGRSENTIINYVKAAEAFINWFVERHHELAFEPKHVSSLDLQEYKDYLLSNAGYLRGDAFRRYSVSSVRVYLKALKTFFDFLVDNGSVSYNPMAKVRLPKIQNFYEEPRWLDRKERSRILNVIEDPELKSRNPWKYSRNKAILFLGLHAGLRRDEISNLRIEDVSFDQSFVFVRKGKGGKSRWVPMNRDLFEALSEWMQHRGDQKDSYVFVSQRGGKLSTQGIWHICCTIAQKAQIENFGPHVLRHTFAHDLTESGVPLQRVADLLGHSNLNYTRVYTRSSKKELRSAVESVSGQR